MLGLSQKYRSKELNEVDKDFFCLFISLETYGLQVYIAAKFIVTFPKVKVLIITLFRDF